MLTFLLCLFSTVCLLAGVLAQHAANYPVPERYRQWWMPLLALLHCILCAWLFSQLSTLVQGIAALVASFVPLFSFLTTPSGLALSFNLLMLLAFALVKIVLAASYRSASERLDELCRPIYEVFYSFDSDYKRWCLRSSLVGVRRILRNLFVAAVVLSCLIMCLAQAWPEAAPFDNAFYPAFAFLLLGEVAYFLSGETREEYRNKLTLDEDGSRRIFQYARLQEVLEHYFKDRELAASSRPRRRLSSGTHEDFCQEMLSSSDRSTRLAGGYFKGLVDRGLLGPDSKANRYPELNHDYAAQTVRLLQGKSVMFSSPFYRDFLPYVFLPANAQLMRNRKVLVLYGEEASQEALEQFVDEGLSFVTGVPDMWASGTLSRDGRKVPDVAFMPFSALGDMKLIMDNAHFFRHVSFTIVVDPSSLLATCQVGLSLLAERLAQGTPSCYCIFDKNADGLVDSLSHALRANLIEVAATEYAQGSSVSMFWNVDGDALQHRLMPGVAHYLGVGTEIGLVALKNQVERVAWASSSAVPLSDQRWINGQYYGELMRFANLPQEQIQLDRRFSYYSDPWSMAKRDHRFIMVEDESCNMFEAYRQFATRGTSECFVNVLSPNYLLRRYMSDNPDIFMADPKAIPQLAPDYSKSERNMIFSLVMMMAQSEDFISEEEVRSRLKYIGWPVDEGVKAALESLLIEHVAANSEQDYAEEQLIEKEVVAYDPRLRDMASKRLYGLEEGSYEASCFESLRNVPLVTEQPDGSELLLGGRLYGHVYQAYLPGQFLAIQGKYYEVMSVSEAAGVVLRRAADHFSQRRYYRQLRAYALSNIEEGGRLGSRRTISDVEVDMVEASIGVRTAGYLEMDDYGDLEGARRVEMPDVPERTYSHKTVLRLRFPGADDAAVLAIAALMREFLTSLFPKDHPYLSVSTTASGAEALPEGVLDRVSVEGAGSEVAVYVIEDSLIDIGLVSSVERNIKRILQLCWDYLDWHQGKVDGVMEEEDEWDVSEKPDFADVPHKKGFFGRLLDRIRGFFRRRKKPKEKIRKVGKGLAGADGPEAIELDDSAVAKDESDSMTQAASEPVEGPAARSVEDDESLPARETAAESTEEGGAQ